MLVVTGVALKLVGFQPVWEATLSTRPRTDPLVVRGMVRRLERFGAWVPGGRLCLPQALAAAILLRRHGMEGELVIGVRPRPFEAHAWLCHEGEVVIGQRERPGHAPIWTGTL